VKVGDPFTSTDEANVTMNFKINDVRRRSDLADYTGDVLVDETLRITDRYNGPAQNEPGTMTGYVFPVRSSCQATADPAKGSDCSLTTTADSVVPGAIKEGKRTMWQLGSVTVFDGGADNDPGTGPNDAFLKQGIFVP
jgi:hypothetical protein